MLTYTALVVLVAVIVGSAFPFLLREHYFRLKEKELLNRAQTISNLLSQTSPSETSQEQVFSLLRSLEQYSGDRIILVDRSGQFQTLFPGGERMPVPGMPRMRRVRSPLSADELEQLWKGKALIKRNLLFPGPPGAAEENAERRLPVLTVAVPVYQKTDASQIAGAVMVTTPVAGITQTATSTSRLVLFILAAAALVALGAGYYFSRTVSRPLREMAIAAREMARGNYQCRVPSAGQDEIGELSASFNYLAEKLEEAARHAQKIEQIRRDFVANVSHELRAPLTLIRGYVEALLDKELTGDSPGSLNAENCHRIILEETLRMERMINELLDLSRLESGRVTLDWEKVDLLALARSMLQKLSPRAQEKGISLRLTAPPELPPVWGDGYRLEQLLLIFLDNALNHTHKGYVELILEAEEEERQVRVSIKDTGEGIPAEDLPYIWERFYKVDKAHTRDKNGTGLGLAIARQLIEMHGGTARAESQPGQGSTFSFTLKIA